MCKLLIGAIERFLIYACCIMAVTFVAQAQSFQVTEMVLKADDGRMSGPCPLRVVFNGSITANGPGTIEYTFVRSDGATGPSYKMEFLKAGSQPVTTDWTLGDATTLPRYEGWQTIKILSPNEIESSREAGRFEINCQVVGKTGPQVLPGPEFKPSGQAGQERPKEKPVGKVEVIPLFDKVYKILPDGEIVVGEPQPIVISLPAARTIWEFMGEY